MPKVTRKRAASRKTRSSLAGHATVAQLVSGIRRVLIWGDSFRHAAEYVSGQSLELATEHRLTGERLCAAM